MIHPFEFDETVNSGDMIITTCAVTKGDLPIKVFWSLNGKSIDNVDGVNVMMTKKRVSQLSIDDVQEYHAGKYSCTATNPAGSDTVSSMLNVNGTTQLKLIEAQFVPFPDYLNISSSTPDSTVRFW